MIRQMTIEDYEGVYALWMKIHGLESGVLTIRKKGSNVFETESNNEVLSQWRMKRL